MKITQLFKIYWPDNGGGIAKVMESIADVLPEYEHEIVVCQDSRKKKGTDDRYHGVAVHRCRQLFSLASTPVSLRFLEEVKKCTRDSDIVIYHFPYPMADLAVLLGIYSGRLVVWWHCGFEKYRKLAFLYRPLVRHTLNKADCILVSSKGNLKNTAILRGYREKCRVIPFCVSEECLRRGSAHAAGLDQQRVSRHAGQKRQVHILFIGRLVWYKGCDILLKAFAKMQYKNCRLVIVGSGPLEQKLKNLAASLKLVDVEFAGMVSEHEKMRQIGQCDFLVLPSVSRAEAFAVVQLEAMAFGKPVVNTALKSGVPYVSVDGVTGKTVRPGSIQELSAAMDELAEDEQLRRRYGANALQVVQMKYTQEQMTKRYRKVFQELAPGMQDLPRQGGNYYGTDGADNYEDCI